MRTRIALAGLLLIMSGCGYSKLDGDVIGQIKYVSRANPIVCPSYVGVGLSLGVMRDGTGSMSTHDVEGWVPSRWLQSELQKSKDRGDIVAVEYKQYRNAICKPDLEITGMRVVQGKP